MSTLHDPAPDRLLGPVTMPAGHALAHRLPAASLSVAGLAAAAGALAALLAGLNLLGGGLILSAALLDAAGAHAASGRGGFPSVLDGVADRYADMLILAGMAAWAHAHESHPAPLAVGFVALIGAVCLSYTTARTRASAGADPAAALFAWTGRDLRLLVAAGGAAVGQVYWALVVVAVLANVPVLWALVRLPRYLRG